MTTYVRGTQVSISADFLHAASVELLIYFGFSGGVEITTMAMTPIASGGPWTATWDSSVATPGTVYWSARSASPTGAIDGSFDLTANPANPSV